MQEFEDLTTERYDSKINWIIIISLFSLMLLLFIIVLIITDPVIIIFVNPTVMQSANPIIFFWNILFIILSDILSYIYIIAIIVLFFVSFIEYEKLEFLKKYRFILLIACLSGFSTQILVNTLKLIIQRPRPFQTYPDLIHLFSHIPTSFSFPSGHTGAAFGFLIPIILYKDKTWKKLSFLIFPIAMGFSRLYLGVHYLSDVIMGMFLGISFSILVGLIIIKTRGFEAEKISKQYIYLIITIVFLVFFLVAEFIIG